MSENTKWPVVFETGDQIEAELIRGLLTSAEIPVVLSTSGLKTMAVFLGHSAPGRILLKVPPDQEALAREILSAQVEMPEES